jgi:hypothetical protein
VEHRNNQEFQGHPKQQICNGFWFTFSTMFLSMGKLGAFLDEQCLSYGYEDEPFHISRNTKSFILDFFSFKRLMYVTEKGARGNELGNKPLVKRGSFVMLSYFVSQNGIIQMMIFYL